MKEKGNIPHHLPYDDGDLEELNKYLLKEGFSKGEIESGVIWVTDEQHKEVHRLEEKRFDKH